MRWLGFDWGEHLYYASDYFEQLYEWAVHLIRAGKAYVDDLSRRRDPRAPRHAHRARAEQPLARPPGRGEPRPVRAHARGRVPRRRARAAGEDRHGLAQHQPARPGALPDPARARTPAPATPGASTRPTTSPTASRTRIEGITHSLCTLEFEDHRPLYDWFIENLPVPSRPRQIEFARLNLTYTVLSQAHPAAAGAATATCGGWDDPRMPTISGIRRRGYPAGGDPRLRGDDRRGQARRRRWTWRMLEHCVRDVLNREAPRRLAVLRPLKVVIENYPEGQVEELDAVNNPEDPAAGHAEGAASRASSTSSATTSWRTRRRSSSASRRAARCACATPTSSPAARR